MNFILIILLLSLTNHAAKYDIALKINEKVIKAVTVDSENLLASNASRYEDDSGFDVSIDDKSVQCFYNVEYANKTQYNLIITMSSFLPVKVLQQLTLNNVEQSKVVQTKSGNYTCQIEMTSL